MIYSVIEKPYDEKIIFNYNKWMDGFLKFEVIKIKIVIDNSLK